MISVLLIDDHEMVRIGVSAYLSVQDDIEVIGEADNGETGIEQALQLKPDVIIMDLVMEPVDGIEATKRIIEQWPEAKIIVVTSFLDNDKVYPALEAGASSYILKTSTANKIADAIRATYNGQSILEPEVASKMMKQMQNHHKQNLHDDLTNREIEILLMICKGKSNQEIADELYIGIKTVKTHVSNILSKLDVQDRTQAVIYAYEHRLNK